MNFADRQKQTSEMLKTHYEFRAHMDSRLHEKLMDTIKYMKTHKGESPDLWFNEIYLCKPALTDYAIYLTGNKETAKDLVQDTFLNAYQKKNFKGKSKIITWLKRIMDNLLLDEIKTPSSSKYELSPHINIEDLVSLQEPTGELS